MEIFSLCKGTYIAAVEYMVTHPWGLSIDFFAQLSIIMKHLPPQARWKKSF